jgi:hypothetical protein
MLPGHGTREQKYAVYCAYAVTVLLVPSNTQ